jgi:hypothetical protein
MFGPGAYRPDPSEGITTPAELPPTERIRYYGLDHRVGHFRPPGVIIGAFFRYEILIFQILMRISRTAGVADTVIEAATLSRVAGKIVVG